jgi:hypothetical protein
MTKPKLPIPGDLLKIVATAKPAEAGEAPKAPAKPAQPDPRGVGAKAHAKPSGRNPAAGQMRSSNRGK